MISTWVSVADSSYWSPIQWTCNSFLMCSMGMILRKRWIWSLTLTIKIFSTFRQAPHCLSTTDVSQIYPSSSTLRDLEHLLPCRCLTHNICSWGSLVVQSRKFFFHILTYIVCITIITLRRLRCGIKRASTQFPNSDGVCFISILSLQVTIRISDSCLGCVSSLWSISQSTSTSTTCLRISIDLCMLLTSQPSIKH